MTNHITSVTSLFEALGRDPNELIGLRESSWLDFKLDPYQLDDERHRAALAKDVSAMANSDSGVIVIGVETSLEVAQQTEIATALRPVASGLVNPRQIADVVHSWVFPALDASVVAHEVPSNTGHLWTIHVERQRDRDRPFMLAREFVGERGPDSNLFGVYRRHGAQNVGYQPSQVHEWLKVGFNMSVNTPVEPLMQDPTQSEEILADDLRALSLPDGYLLYFLQSRPQRPTELSGFYRGSSNSLFESLQRRPSIRGEWGFDLPEGEPERTPWDGLRVTWPQEDSLSVSRQGITTAVIGQRHLAWGTERYARQGEAWINPVALVEFTLEFWRFYIMQIIPRLGSQTTSLWRSGMTNLGGQSLTKLPLRPLGDFRSEAQEATSDEFITDWSVGVSSEPGSLAFKTLAEVYARFGYDEEVIPFARDRKIQEEAIRALR